jgi:hypothetical protein
MASTPRIPKAEITGADWDALERLSGMLGEVPEPAEVMWHNRRCSPAPWGSAARSRSGIGSTRT